MSRREATMARILAAATMEFATHGFAGARVDRIATAAACNKQALYAYFGDKEALWKAVYDRMVVDTIEGVPIDGADLPGYAERLFMRYRAHPEILRLNFWHALERVKSDGVPQMVVDARGRKLSAIRKAQQEGRVTKAMSAELLLAIILSISMMEESSSDNPTAGTSVTAKRKAIGEAVRRLIAP